MGSAAAHRSKPTIRLFTSQMQNAGNKNRLLILALCVLTQISKILVQSNKQQPKEKPNRTNKISNLSTGFTIS